MPAAGDCFLRNIFHCLDAGGSTSDDKFIFSRHHLGAPMQATFLEFATTPARTWIISTNAIRYHYVKASSVAVIAAGRNAAI